MNDGHYTGKVVILAAGRSSRLGRPKQLLPYAGSTLIQYAIHQAITSGIGEVIVVLGANHELIGSHIDPALCKVLVNPAWEEGMSSSILNAIEYIELEKNQPMGVLFMVCDQPYVSAFLLRELWDRFTCGNEKMVACEYEDRLGTPAVFHSSLLSELFALQGDRGAGKYLNEHKSEVLAIPFPDGVRDIDTEEEYKALLHGAANNH